MNEMWWKIWRVAESIDEVRGIGCGSGLCVPIGFVVIVDVSEDDSLGDWEIGKGDEALRS
jgi:hypothetical protein